jgi:cardiolipin synthase
MFDIAIWEVIGLAVVCLHVAGLTAAVHALKYSRTPQGAIASASRLVTFPYEMLPVY